MKRAALGVAALGAAVGAPLAVAAPASAAIGVLNTIPVGSNPQGIAVDPSSGMVFVANQGSGTVSVFKILGNGTTPGGAGTIALPSGSTPMGVAVDPNTQMVFVTDPSSGVVWTFSENGGGPTAIHLCNCINPGTPEGIAVDPNNGSVYVADGFGGPAGSDGAVLQISEASRQVQNSWDTGPGTDPVGVAVDPNSQMVFVTDQNAGTVLEFPEASATPNTIETIPGASGVAVDTNTAVAPNVRPVYVHSEGTVSAFTENGGPVTTTSVDVSPLVSPFDVAVDPNSKTVYAVNQSPGTVSAFPESGGPATSIHVGTEPVGVAVDPANGNAYVTNSADGTVSVLGAVNTSPSPSPSPSPSNSPSPSPSPSSSTASSSSGAVTATGTVNEVVSLSGLSGTVTFPPAAAGTTTTVTGAEAYTASTNDPAGYTLTLGASGSGLTSASGTIPNTDLTITETGFSPGSQAFGAGPGAILTIAQTAAPSTDSYGENWALAIPSTAAASTYSESFVYLVLGN